ncbi:MAG: hypothetical protein QOI37_382 [Chloroflexota bacterium]|nr:hypothetical protein [Chloroflexota bacterium]
MDGSAVAVLVAGLVGAWLLLLVVLWIARPRDVRLTELLRLVPDVLRLVRDLLRDPIVPRRIRWLLVGLLAWLVSPIDLIPEFIPVLGPLDDVIVAIIVLRYVRRRLGPDEFRRRWPGTAEGYELLSGVLG